MFAFLGHRIVQKKYPKKRFLIPIYPYFLLKSLQATCYFNFFVVLYKNTSLKTLSFSNHKYKGSVWVVIGFLVPQSPQITKSPFLM